MKEEYYHVRDVTKGLAKWLRYSFSSFNNRTAETTALGYLIEESHQERMRNETKARQTLRPKLGSFLLDDNPHL